MLNIIGISVPLSTVVALHQATIPMKSHPEGNCHTIGLPCHVESNAALGGSGNAGTV